MWGIYINYGQRCFSIEDGMVVYSPLKLSFTTLLVIKSLTSSRYSIPTRRVLGFKDIAKLGFRHDERFALLADPGPLLKRVRKPDQTGFTPRLAEKTEPEPIIKEVAGQPLIAYTAVLLRQIQFRQEKKARNMQARTGDLGTPPPSLVRS